MKQPETKLATDVNKPAEKPAATPAPVAKPAEKVASKPADKPAAKPAEKVASKPVDKPAPKPAEKVASKPADKAAAKPAEKVASKSADKPVAKPAEKVASKPADKPAAKPAKKVASKPAAKPKAVAKPTPTKPAEKPKPKVDESTNQQQALAQKIQNSASDSSNVYSQPSPVNAENKWISKLKSVSLFMCLVLIPWLIVIYYVLAVAHPRYVSTSEVVVKQVGEAQMASSSGFAALLGVNSTSVEDANYLTEYILSNDMIRNLDDRFDFRNEYYLEGADPLYALKKDATQEELLTYFKKRVHIHLDEQTHVLTVSTEGFNPDYALELNKAVLAESEVFVNKISQHIAQDQLRFAQAQVMEAGQALNAKKEELLKYQNDNQIFDPQANAQMINQLVGSLQAQLSALRTEERQLLSYLNQDAPQIVSIRSQIAAVQKQLQNEQAKLTSSNTSRLNRQAVQFESLKSEVEFASELYKISLSSFEQARLEAFRKMKNLIVISTPYKAEEALYPRKAYVIGTALALLLIFYGFIRLIMAVIRDHAN